MNEILCKYDYEQQTAASRDRRMQWWRDTHAGITAIALEFDGPPQYTFASYYPQLHGGRDIATGMRI